MPVWTLTYRLSRTAFQTASVRVRVDERRVREYHELAQEEVVTEDHVREYATDRVDPHNQDFDWEVGDSTDHEQALERLVPPPPPPPVVTAETPAQILGRALTGVTMEPAPPPAEPILYEEVVYGMPTTGVAYRHPSECPCLTCERNTEFRKTPLVPVRVNRKKGVVSALDWITGRVSSYPPDEE